MSDVLSPDSVIGDLPDWQGASSTRLAGGLTNNTWRLEKDSRKAVLKIDHELRSTPYNTRFSEAIVQSAAARAGLAGGVIFADNQIYICEYIEGTVWDRTCFDIEGNIERLAETLQRLHSLPLSGRKFRSLAAAEDYAQSIDRNEKIVSVCLDIVRNIEAPTDYCFCHNDLVAGNIIETPEIMFLDWEYARDNDRLFDLATIVEHHELSEKQTDTLLSAYFDGDYDRWREPIAQQRRLYLALYWLWAASRPGHSDADLSRISIQLTTSYS